MLRLHLQENLPPKEHTESAVEREIEPINKSKPLANIELIEPDYRLVAV